MNGRVPVLLVQRKCVLHNVMFIVAFEIDGIILHHAVPPRQMVNAAYYCTVVANKTGPTRVADFRAVFTAERPYLFLGPETTYAVEQ